MQQSLVTFKEIDTESILKKVLLPGIMILGGLLRWTFSNIRGIFYDDAFSYHLSARSIGDILAGTAADTMPPLYYLLLHGWMRLGREIWVLRSLNIILSLLIILIIYRIISDHWGRNAGLWAAFLTAISPFQIYHAQELRMYTLLGITQLGYFWFFLRLRTGPEFQSERRVYWLGLVLCGSLAMYTHNLAVFALVVPNFILVLQKDWKELRKLILAQGVIAVLAAPWLIMIPGQINKIQRAFWTPLPGIVEVLQAIILFHSSLPLPTGLMFISAILSLQIFFVTLIEARRTIFNDRVGLVLWSLLAIPPILLFLISYLMRPLFVTRAFIISSLAYYGLLGIVIANSKIRPIRWFIMVSAIGLSFLGTFYQYQFNEFPRSPYRESVQYLHTIIEPGDIIVHDNKLSYFPAHYYAPDLPQRFLADEPGSHNDTYAAQSQKAINLIPEESIRSAIQGAKSVYFVVFSKAIQEYKTIGIDEHPIISWLNSNYSFADHQMFNDLEIYHFSSTETQ